MALVMLIAFFLAYILKKKASHTFEQENGPNKKYLLLIYLVLNISLHILNMNDSINWNRKFHKLFTINSSSNSCQFTATM